MLSSSLLLSENVSKCCLFLSGGKDFVRGFYKPFKLMSWTRLTFLLDGCKSISAETKMCKERTVERYHSIKEVYKVGRKEERKEGINQCG